MIAIQDIDQPPPTRSALGPLPLPFEINTSTFQDCTLFLHGGALGCADRQPSQGQVGQAIVVPVHEPIVRGGPHVFGVRGAQWAFIEGEFFIFRSSKRATKFSLDNILNRIYSIHI